MIDRHADLRPDQDAVVDPRVALSYARLREEVEDLTDRFRMAGISAGVPVLVLFDACAESVVAYWALRSIGAVVVVGDPTAGSREISHYLETTGARHVLAGARAADHIESARGCAWHTLGRSTHAGLRDWVMADTQEPWSGADTDHAVILFSSGTTGTPKAIVHTDMSVMALHETLLQAWMLSPRDRVLGALPFHTIYGLLFSAGSAIHAGASLVLLDRYHPRLALEAIRDQRITTAAFVPAMVLMILNFEGKEAYDLRSLRMCYTASAPISDADVERFSRFAGVPLLANYGMTEIPGAAVERADAPHLPGSVGRISPGFEVAARNPEGRPLPPGETGEITMRGPSMMKAYLGDPDQTAMRIRDGWIYSQDIGRVDEQGNIFLSGRTSEFIMRGGLNISPIEVENALSRHAAVLDCAVVGAEDAVLGQVVVAFVVAPEASDRAALPQVLAEHCGMFLSPAKAPARYVFVDELPRNAGGKVLRRRLQEEATAHHKLDARGRGQNA